MQLNPLIKLDPSKLPLTAGPSFPLTGPLTLANLANALNSGNYSLQMESGVADGASAIGYTFDTTNALGTAAKIASFQTNSIEKVYITGDGDLNLASALQFSATDYIYESSGAFIVGDGSSGTGSGAVSVGRSNSISSGSNNAAIGLSNTITSVFAGVGIGVGNTVQGILDIALGISCTTDNGGAALGKSCTASAANSIAFGSSVTASASESIAIGRSLTATQAQAISMGIECDATGVGSVAMGAFTDASGNTSFAAGRLCVASATNSLAIGRNVNNAIADALQIGANNTAKMTMLSSGFLGLAGVTTPTEFLEISGNLFLNTDNNKILLGAGKDYEIYHDSTDNLFNSNNGAHKFLGADFYIGDNFYYDEINKRLALGGTETEMTVDGVTKSQTLSTHITGGSQDYTWASHVHSNAVGPVIAGARSRGSEASPSNVEAGDNLLDLLALGYDETDDDYLEHAAIHLDVDGTPGNNDAPGKIVFFTTPSGSKTLTEACRIDANQNLLMKDQKFIVTDKASGNGIKVDAITPTFGFADLLGDQFSKNTGATKPVLTTYNGVINGWQFGDGDEAYLTYHIPHDYVPGSDIFLHIHWSQTSATATGGTIDFKYFAIYAKGHNQVTGSTFTTTPITATFSSIDINDGGSGLNQRQQHLTEVIISGASATSALFDRDDFEPDGVIELTFEMDANNLTNSVSVLDPFIHFVDIHYNTTGLIGTKDKAPDFYV